MTGDSIPSHITVTGVVLAVDWDRQDRPLLVSIDTGDTEYQVDDDDNGRRLLVLIGAEIEAQGEAYEDAFGIPYLTLTSFQVLQPPDPSLVEPSPVENDDDDEEEFDDDELDDFDDDEEDEDDDDDDENSSVVVTES